MIGELMFNVVPYTNNAYMFLSILTTSWLRAENKLYISILTINQCKHLIVKYTTFIDVFVHY